MTVDKEEKRITLVGAGPVGSLMALVLAQRGYFVDIHERRPDMRKENISAGRSINLAISIRGFYALKEVGLEEKIRGIGIAMPGRFVHPSPKTGIQPFFQPYGKNSGESIYSVSRGELNKILMTTAEETGKVRIFFNQKTASVDFKSNSLEIEDSTANIDTVGSREPRKIHFARLLGTDGSHSEVRASLLKETSQSCDEDYLEHGYKEILLPSGPRGEFLLEKNALHIWPRVSFMLIALPNLDGSFTCTLFLPLKGPLSFEALQTRNQIQPFFQEYFPDFHSLMPQAFEEFLKNPTGNMVTVRTPQWNYESKALLLGDAAHAIVPFFGQGMNCGFEDCTFFGSMLDRNSSLPWQDVWDAIIHQFGELRKPDTDAIADLALGNFIEMRDKVGDPKFQFEKQLERHLQSLFPEDYIPRYSLVSFSRISYRVAKKAGILQDEILKELSQGMSSPMDIDQNRARTLIQKKLGGLKSVLR